MVTQLIRYCKGYVRIQLIGPSPERVLNLCRNHKIFIWNLMPVHGNYELSIGRKNFRQLEPILQKTGMKLKVVAYVGMPYLCAQYGKRYTFLLGILYFVLILYLCSLVVWTIDLEGNLTYTDQVLLEFLESTQVYHGMWKSKLNCSQIASDLRKEFSGIVWVSASIEGSCLRISIKENTDTFSPSDTSTTPSDIIADFDGTITNIITRNGMPLVSVGTEVKAGERLVTGIVEVINDSGEVINQHLQKADADIYAKRIRNYREELPLSYKKKAYTGKRRKTSFLKIGNLEFSVGWLKNSFQHQSKKSWSQPLYLTSQFRLPINFGERLIEEYEIQEAFYTREEVQKLLSQSFQHYCEQLETQDIQILDTNVHIEIRNGVATATGTLSVIEPIGKQIDIDF